MRTHLLTAVALLGAGLTLGSCNFRHDTDAHEQEAHATQPKPAPVSIPPSLRDTLQLLAQ